MAASGYTEIQLYTSSTSGVVPSGTNLVAGELAINSYDGKLYYKSTAVGTSGNVVLLASAAGAVAATNIAGGTSGEIPVQNGVGSTTFIAPPGTSGTYLGWNGSGFVWASTTGPSGYSGFSGFSGYSGIGFSGGSGYSGFSGFSGYSGTSGNSGYSGISGFSGYSGTNGASGFSGYSGTNGVSGFSGYSGSGVSGFSGYSGYSGVGASGSQGTSGYSGYSGFSGINATGQSGFSGFSGVSGYSGFSGYSGSGISGYSGFSGYSGTGTSGYSGYSGAVGTSGYSGYSGYSGISGYSGSGVSGYSGTSGYSGATPTSVANITGGAVGNLLYQTGASSTGFLANQTGKVIVGGAATPAYVATSGISGVGSAINIVGGTSGQIPYQTSANTTAFTVAPTTGTSSNPGFLAYTGSGFVWDQWLTFLTSTNINSALGYTAADAAGTNASGTWTINVTGSAATATTAGAIYNGVSGWNITPTGTKLYFNYNGTSVASLDSSGNFISLANITAYGTP